MLCPSKIASFQPFQGFVGGFFVKEGGKAQLCPWEGAGAVAAVGVIVAWFNS